MEDTNGNRKALIEAALFAAGKPLTLKVLAQITDLDEDEVQSLAGSLVLEYSNRSDSGLEIRSFEDKYVMQVQARFAPHVVAVAPRELEAPLVRTLAIIAYKQPIAQSEIVKIRGNKSYDHIHELERLGLISAVKSGRSKLLQTTKGFADYFGLESDNPEFVKKMIGTKRSPVGVTPMYQSLAVRMGLDYIVIGAYHPNEEDLEKMEQVDLLVVAPGYKEIITENYSKELIEAKAKTLSQLKESIEQIAEAVPNLQAPEPLLSEIDSLLQMYRQRAVNATAVKPLTPMIKEMAEDLRIDIDETAGVSAAPDYSKLDAEIIVPTHQDYEMDIVERLKQRYEMLLLGLRA